MNQLSFPLLFLCFLVFSSCKKDGLYLEEATVQEIIMAEDRVAIASKNLPYQIRRELGYNYFETYTWEAYFAKDIGYEITLANGDHVYFNHFGWMFYRYEQLEHLGCSEYASHYDEEQLPENIQDYIASNYPDTYILRVKSRNLESYVVQLSNMLLLSFHKEGQFEGARLMVYDCYANEASPSLDLSTLPPSIYDYLTANYPEASLKVAYDETDFILAGLIDGEDRLLLGFDMNGNFLFNR